MSKRDNTTFHKVHRRVLISYIIVLLILTVGMMFSLISASNRVLKDKVSALVASNSRQIEMNLDSYLKGVESNAALMYSDEKYYRYDATNPALDEYDKIQAQDAIADRIADLALMDNYSDFAVIYADGSKVGWTSNTTSGLFSSKELFEKLSDCVAPGNRKGEWVFGFGEVTDRMYYIRRLNPNAMLMTSFYSRELLSVFEYPDALNGTVIDLVDDDFLVLYSSDSSRIGTILDSSLLDDSNGDYIVNSNMCENGWRVVCSVPTSVVTSDLDRVRYLFITITALLAIICIAISYASSRNIMKPVDDVVSDLKEDAQTDGLSGLNNKKAFVEKVGSLLAGSSADDTNAFIMIDLDNFKLVNDKLGHSHGDDVIKRMGAMLSESLSEEYIVGRIGGDEFALFSRYEGHSPEDVKPVIREFIEQLREKFAVVFEAERSKVALSMSIGAVVKDKERRFSNLYEQADAAMYEAKKAGKDGFVFYESDRRDGDIL